MAYHSLAVFLITHSKPVRSAQVVVQPSFDP